ncbi:hypothetical protein FRC12_011478 [Ceratobasidium sp. 428]|nr:hypothetical protein FRC12_011478 [Ceratobasidium sp. 428]
MGICTPLVATPLFVRAPVQLGTEPTGPPQQTLVSLATSRCQRILGLTFGRLVMFVYRPKDPAQADIDGPTPVNPPPTARPAITPLLGSLHGILRE